MFDPIHTHCRNRLSRNKWSLATGAMLAIALATSAGAQTSQVDIVGLSSALSTVAQRHMIRIQPAGHSPVLLLAVQNDGWSFQHFGLLWYRSNDEGATWFYYRDALAQPDLAVFDQSKSPQTLHLSADLIAVGNDIAAVYSYDTTQSGFAADAWDSKRVVYFQWWRYDGVNDWNPGTRLTVASVSGTQAYHRAEITRDSLGRLWVQAFLRQASCPNPGVTCTGDILRTWVSTDGGATFQAPQDLATLTNQLGGGRLISVGSKLIMLWGDYTANPAQMRTRNDSDPLTTWSAVVNAFPDSAHIYHGAALSAAADGTGGLHVVYKEWIGPNDEQQLYYRYYNGTTFGTKQAVDTPGDWALQPAVTTVGSDLFVCLNHTITTDVNQEMRLYKKSAGWGAFEAIDTLVLPKAYPNALESSPATPAFLPCAFGTGNPATWGDESEHTVKVARELIPSDYSLSANPANISAARGSSATSSIRVSPTGGFSSNVTLSASGVPAGATVTFSPGTAASGSASTATFNAGTAQVGIYSVSVNGSGGGLSHSTPLQCTVTQGGDACTPLTSCNNQCVNTSTDVSNCGGCGTVCPGTSNGGPVCSNGTCTVACNSGFHVCEGTSCLPNSQLCP